MSLPKESGLESRLEWRLGEALKARGWTLSVAESCTGGLIMHRITNISGSSSYLIGGVVTYAYEAKVKMLGVNQEDLIKNGAVSETVARQMVRGVRAAFDTNLALSVTEIAGPGGATPDKPVGLTYIALSSPDHEIVIRRVWTEDREGNKRCSADAALELALNYLTTGISSATGVTERP